MENKDFEQVYDEYRNQSDMEAGSASAHPGQEQIVAVRKNGDGDIIAFKTESGRELDYITALDEAKAGTCGCVP